MGRLFYYLMRQNMTLMDTSKKQDTALISVNFALNVF